MLWSSQMSIYVAFLRNSYHLVIVYSPRIKIRGYNMRYPYGIDPLGSHTMMSKSRRLGSYCRDGIHSIHKRRTHNPLKAVGSWHMLQWLWLTLVSFSNPRIKIRGYKMNHPYGIVSLESDSLMSKSRRLGSYCRDGIHSIHKRRNHNPLRAVGSGHMLQLLWLTLVSFSPIHGLKSVATK